MNDPSPFAHDVRCSLMKRPRELPSRYLYDELGSALFDAICHLPWYPITRAEFRLIAAHRAAVFHEVAPSTVVELGSGSGEKLRALVEASGPRREPLDVHVVDVSPRALARSTEALASVAGVRLTAHRARYEEGLQNAVTGRSNGNPTLVLFLGSNIGNFDSAGAGGFLRRIRDVLAPGDALLLGTDLVKPERDLLLAYDDPLGVTAAFNRNLLVRINRELGANFDLEAFGHRAVWNPSESRVEMHLVAKASRTVQIEAAQLTDRIEAGETIWTESSYKFDPAAVVNLVERAGFTAVHRWIDEPGRFALVLARAC